MNSRRLFVASCITLVASAFSFIVRQDVLPAWGQQFNLNNGQLGTIGGMAFWGMAIAMLLGAPLCDKLGMKLVIGLAFLSHLVGALLTLGTPYLAKPGAGIDPFTLLSAATFLVGAGNGLVEIAINPLAATLYPTKKTHMLNILHAWWPGGLMLGGIITLVLNSGLGLNKLDSANLQLGWQVKVALILIPTLLYGIMFLVEKMPVTERVASGVTTAEMFGQAVRPMFLLWAFCMLLTASTELAPQGMQSLVLNKTAGMSGTVIVIYTSAIMFVLRHFAGPIAHRFSPVGMLIGSSVLSAIGLYALSFAFDPTTAVLAATVYGLGIVYFWPTMLGVTAERFPRGGALLLGLIGCIGNVAVGLAQPTMGGINDRVTIAAIPSEVQPKVIVDGTIKDDLVAALPAAEKAQVEAAQKSGAQWSFRYVSALPLLLVVLFAGIAISDKAKGGYMPEKLPEATVATDY